MTALVFFIIAGLYNKRNEGQKLHPAAFAIFGAVSAAVTVFVVIAIATGRIHF